MTIETKATTARFEEGKTYFTNGAVDSITITVIKRTAKMIQIESDDTIYVRNVRYKISENQHGEFIKLGSHAGAKWIYAVNEYTADVKERDEQIEEAYRELAAKNREEFAEARRVAAMLEATVTTEAQDIATEAEIVLAAQNSNTDEVKADETDEEVYYHASILGYTDRYTCEYFSNPISAYKWLRRKANRSRNYADGSWKIDRYDSNGITTILEFAGSYEQITDENLRNYIEQRDAKEHIESMYCDMQHGINRLIANYGLTQEQAEQVAVASYANKNFTNKDFDAMIERFKAENAPADNNDSESETKLTRAEIEAEIKIIVEEIDEFRNELMVIEAETEDEDFDETTCTPQSHIDYLNDTIASNEERYNELQAMLNNLDPEPPQPETDGSEDDIDTNDAFNFLPDLDELNDVCSVPQARPFTVETSYTPYGDVRTKLYINDEKISLFNGEFVRLWNGKYHAYISNLNGGKIGVVMPGESLTQLFRDFDLDEPSEEFFKIMAERGACTIDELEILRNKIANLETELDKIENEYDKGGNQDKLDKLANRWDELYLKLYQQKEDYKQKYRAGVRETCELINDAAPEGWSISAAVTFTRSDINHPKTQYRIHFHGEQIAELDTLALAKFLSIDEFFEQFKPLVDKNFTPAVLNIKARQREIDDLNEMRKELCNDTERVKILDELIDDAHREKIRNELAG